MQIIQNVHVDGFEITPNIISVGTRGSFGISKINFVLSSEWENNACKVVFHPLFGAPIEVIYTGEPIDIPFEIMKNGGIFEYVVSGVVRDESGVSKQISLPGKIKVLFTLDDEGRESAGFKPSALAQVLAIIGNIKELDQYDANNIIEALEFIKKNSSGGEITEADPTVPEWAKEKEKPTYTASEVGADPAGTASSKISEHNVDSAAHNDLRILFDKLKTKVENFLDVDDATADELSEVIELIRDNSDLIEGITKSKVNVSDIINNLTTNVSNKPLSAAQGVAIKALIDELEESIADAEGLAKKAVRTVNGKAPDENGNVEIEGGGGGGIDEEALNAAIEEALNEAKENGEFDGPPGDDGVSPTIAVITITGGHRIAITDKNGTKNVDIMDGAAGADGRGIKSVARTSGSGSAGSTDTYTITFTDNATTTFTVYNGKNGKDGKDGENGLGFHDAYVNEDGQLVLVYEGDSGEIVVGNVVGENGEDGNGIASAVLNSDYTLTLTFTDKTSYTTPSIRGARGAMGEAGTSITITETRHDGHATIIVFSDGTIVNIPDGVDGSPGLRGKDGADGTSVTVSKVTESTASGGTNVVTFSDGSTLNVKNGKDGENYALTASDKNEIADSIATGLTLGVHTDGLVYIFKDGVPIGNGVEMGVSGDVVGYVDSSNNITLSGNLADGVYTLKYEGTDGNVTEIGTLTLKTEVEPTYTNLIPKSTVSPSSTTIYNGKGYKENTRWSSSSAAESSATGVYVTGCIPWTNGGVVRLKNIRMNKNDTASNVRHICSYNGSAWSSQDISLDSNFKCVWDADGNLTQFTLPNWGNTHFRLNTGYIGDDSILTIDEPIE